MDFFKKLNPQVSSGKKEVKEINPILYTSGENPEVYFITNRLDMDYNAFSHFICETVGRPVSFQILYSFIAEEKKVPIKSNIEKYYLKNSLNFSYYIPSGSKIITIGQTLYAITKNSSLSIEGFYDKEWNNSYFYDPFTLSWVFPVDEWSKEPISLWEQYFFKTQILDALQFDSTPVRKKAFKRVYVEEPNAFLKEYRDKELEVAWDLETEGLHFEQGVLCVTLSFDGITGYYLPWEKIDVSVLNDFFKNKFLIGANLKFDCKFLKWKGVESVHIDFDTLNAGHCLNELQSNSLETHGWVYTFRGGHEIPLKEYKMKYPSIKSYASLPKDLLFQYAVDDAIITFQVYKAQKEKLSQDVLLENYFYSEIIPNLNMFIDIELEGIHIDWEKMKELAEETKKEIEEKKKEFFNKSGVSEFNLNSGEQLGEILEKELNFPDIGKRTKKGIYQTDVHALNEWSKKGYALADQILAYREPVTFLKTFIGEEEEGNAYWKYKTERGTIHPTYGVCLTNSHRNSCNYPNLQQAPKKGKRAKQFRSVFIPPSSDFYLCEGDYSGFQLRIAGILSGDENLRQAFLDPEIRGDLHSVSARNIFHPYLDIKEFLEKKDEEPYKSQRAVGKGSNFQFLFGGGSYAFTQDVISKNWTIEECINFLEDKGVGVKDKKEDIFLQVGSYIRTQFFEGFPKLKEWHKDCQKEAIKNGYVRCVHGARRLLPQLKFLGKKSYHDLTFKDKKVLSDLLNISINTRVQNFEIVIISRGMRSLKDYLKKNRKKSKLTGMIHDAVLKYIYKDEKEEIKNAIKSIMERSYPEFKGLQMEYEAELADPEKGIYWGYGDNWF